MQNLHPAQGTLIRNLQGIVTNLMNKPTIRSAQPQPQSSSSETQQFHPPISGGVVQEEVQEEVQSNTDVQLQDGMAVYSDSQLESMLSQAFDAGYARALQDKPNAVDEDTTNQVATLMQQFRTLTALSLQEHLNFNVFVDQINTTMQFIEAVLLDTTTIPLPVQAPVNANIAVQPPPPPITVSLGPTPSVASAPAPVNDQVPKQIETMEAQIAKLTNDLQKMNSRAYAVNYVDSLTCAENDEKNS